MNARLLSLMVGAGLAMGCGTENDRTIIIQNPGDSGSGSGSTSGATTGPGPSSATGPSTTAKDMYVNEVHPSLVGTCGSCHIDGIGTPYFLADDANVAYDIIKGLGGFVTEPSQSRLILKPEHAGGAAPALTDPQKTLVSDWLEAEMAENPNPVDPTELTPLQQLEKFGACMSYADWEDPGNGTPVYEVANSNVIYQNNPVPCMNCHSGQDGEDGENGALLSGDPVGFFLGMQKMPYILKLAASTLNGDGTFSDIAKSNRWVEKCVEDSMLGNPHPPCVNGQLPQVYAESIDLFFQKTYERWAADQCDLAVPPPGP
jgi:mono/diheme cytochrome c family protein